MFAGAGSPWGSVLCHTKDRGGPAWNNLSAVGSVAIWLEGLAIHDVIWHSRRALALTMSWTEYDAEEISYNNPPNDISPLLEFYEWQDDNSRWYCKMCFIGATAGHLKNRKHCNKVWSEKEKQAARAEAGAKLQSSPELLHIKLKRREQTLLPASVLKGKSKNYYELLGF